MTAPRETGSDGVALRVIAGFKLLKALILATAGLGAQALVGRDLGEALTNWARTLHIDPNGQWITLVLEHVTSMAPSKLRAVTAGLLFYAVLMATEGIGLMLAKRWAEYLTVIVTLSFIPLEIYEMTKRFTPLRLAILVVNLAIVAYLIRRLRHHD